MEKTEIRGLDLPGLVLACSGKLSEVDREEGSVYEAVDEMVDEFAEHERCAIGLSKEGIDGSEDVLRPRRPGIQILTDLGQVRQRVPREVAVAFDAPSRQVTVGDPEDANHVDQHPTAPLALLPRAGVVLEIRPALEELPFDSGSRRSRSPRWKSQQYASVGDERGATRAACHEAIHEIASPE